MPSNAALTEETLRTLSMSKENLQWAMDASGLLHPTNTSPPSSVHTLLNQLLGRLRDSSTQAAIAALLAPDSEGDEGADCLLWLPANNDQGHDSRFRDFIQAEAVQREPIGLPKMLTDNGDVQEMLGALHADELHCEEVTLKSTGMKMVVLCTKISEGSLVLFAPKVAS